MKQLNLFATEEQLERLSLLGDPLEKLNGLVNWEMFRPLIESAIHKDRSRGGRPPYPAIMMLKIVMLQQWYGLSEVGVELQITDRLSFMRFLGLSLGEKVPDANTIWAFKEELKKHDLMRKLFDMFGQMLAARNLVTRTGSIIDATFVTVPKRHTSSDDNKRLKAGEALEDLPAKCAERLAKGEIKAVENVMAQMDTDARWTKKGDEDYFGYKDHVKCDSESKIITNYSVTSASVHDVKEFVGLIDEQDEELSADAGYVGEEYITEILKKYPHLKLHICARAYKTKPLTDEQKTANTTIARIRCRIEHIFGYMTRFMGGLTCRCHGIARIIREIGAKNLAYNIKRYIYLIR